MITQTIEFNAVQDQTLIVRLFAATPGDDVVIQTASNVTQSPNRKVIRAVFTDLPAGEYRLMAFLDGIRVADWYTTLRAETGTYECYETAVRSVIDSTGALSPAQDTKLTQLYEAVYPPVATDPPLVITPSTPGTVTGYAVCYGLTGAVQAGVQVQYRLQSGPTRDLGRIFRGATTGVATSGLNGLVQFPGLVPGATYYFLCGNTEVSMTIPANVDPLHGYALPSFTAM